jgi:hypothetical protein
MTGLRHCAEADMHLLAVGRHVRAAILATTAEDRQRQVRIVDERLQEMHRELEAATPKRSRRSSARWRAGPWQQTSGIGQINDAVAQLDQVTQLNAALVEESAAAADSLSHQAQQLVQSVAVFKLGTPDADAVIARVQAAVRTGGRGAAGARTGCGAGGGQLGDVLVPGPSAPQAVPGDGGRARWARGLDAWASMPTVHHHWSCRMRKLVTVRKIDGVKRVDDYEVLVIDGVAIDEYHSPRDQFHAGEYCVFIDAGVKLPAKPGRPWTPTERTVHVEVYPTSAFPEIIEEMMMLAHDHDGFTTEDYLQIRETDFARHLGVTDVR